MQALKTLIDKASEMCGSDAALARALKVSKVHVSLMHSGKRKVTPVLAAKLADIAGYDLDAALRMATIQAAEGTPDEWLISEIVGKDRAVGAAAMLDSSYKDALISSTATKSEIVKKSDSLYIVSILRWSANQLKRHLKGRSAERNGQWQQGQHHDDMSTANG